MSHVLTTAPDARVPLGTNASIEQRFGAVADPHRSAAPNLLLIHSDLDASLIGAYAGERADTPHLDRLAKSGTRFTAVAGTAGPPDLHAVLDPLADCGYDTARFETADAAIAFLGLRRDAAWAAYVSLGAEDADDATGSMARALRRSGQHRRTLVLFVGAQGMTIPTLLSWPGQIAPRQRHDEPIAGADWIPTLLEIARPGATFGLDFDGVDLSGHLLDGQLLPERAASGPVRTRAA